MPAPAIHSNEDFDHRNNLLESSVSKIAEHFDSVVIIATAQQTDETTAYFTCGRGNVYASAGAVRKYSTSLKKHLNS